ncbi:hypothetical protein EAH79_00775 [Sphingomonas koreensis]|nr:hypothetical protein EAH79_00775 [Sphingomonas koreensis]
MHYTSVPNILKVLNPLFLDGLREQLEAAGDSKQKLRNLRKRLGNIRVFDPACGSGNFLVIAYKEMRAMEAQIVERLGGEANLKLAERRSVIPLSNFYGIEIKGFAAEIARLALLIAEFQADCVYLSQQEARAMVLPLHKTGQIHGGPEANALRLNWLEVCPPVGTALVEEQDLGGPTGRMALDEDGLGGGAEVETYICGNPPYRGSQWQTDEQKADLRRVFEGETASPGSLDYVCGWFMKARRYMATGRGGFAFVTTNSVNQGRQVAGLWPLILFDDAAISFAHRNIKWANLATDKAGVTVNIIGVSNAGGARVLFDEGTRHVVDAISPYLVPGQVSEPTAGPLFEASESPEIAEQEHLQSGTLYVLRSRSDHPTIAASRDLVHKIGITGGPVEARIAGARDDATYLLADVDVVATYKLYDVNRPKLERLIHRVLHSVRFEAEIPDRFGKLVRPREWFFVPVPIVDEIIERIGNGTLADVVYDPQRAELVPITV